jgi:hypothetical protein
MKRETQIAKVVNKRNIHERELDVVYWQSKEPADRLEAVEQIRCEYHQWRYGAQPRLQRVYKVIKRA